MNFPTPADELAMLTDLKNHYEVAAQAIMQKPSFNRNDIDAYQAFQGLADAAQEVIDLLKNSH